MPSGPLEETHFKLLRLQKCNLWKRNNETKKERVSKGVNKQTSRVDWFENGHKVHGK